MIEEVLKKAEHNAEIYRGLIAELGPKVVAREWEYYQEYARNFKDNTPEERYGILIMDQDPQDSNMLYAADPLTLRIIHLKALCKLGTGSAGERQRKFLNWLEKMEGKA